MFLFFFFQAEDGIRDHCVTGVQTCALPIWDLIVTLHLQNQQDAPRFQHIFETNFNYAPLMYVLLFPYGEPGWGPGICLCNTGGLNGDDDADEVQGLGEVLSLPLLKFNSYHSLIHPKTLMPTGEAMSQ